MTELDRPADPKGTTRCTSCGTETFGWDLCLDCDDWFSGELDAKTSRRWVPRIWREINDALGQCDRGPTKLGQPTPRGGL